MYTGVLVQIAQATLILSQYQVVVSMIVNDGVTSDRSGVIVRGIIGRTS